MMFYESRIKNSISKVLKSIPESTFSFRTIEKTDIDRLYTFFQQQEKSAFDYFKPHSFDKNTLEKLLKSHSFFMFGVFNMENQIVGYFFLRCFINRKAFRGKIVDKAYQGQGLAKKMGYILSDICWKSNFRLFATISKNNTASISSSKAVNQIQVVKELPDNYIYIEYSQKNNTCC
ncbi:GNAT family N-acetyltransferase [Parabacteroides sp. OttesenSCG-928-G21]|nr:GNAT family N-acetyltransferase [Parabacteroides sp. OttesenSCG-928-G21]